MNFWIVINHFDVLKMKEGSQITALKTETQEIRFLIDENRKTIICGQTRKLEI